MFHMHVYYVSIICNIYLYYKFTLTFVLKTDSYTLSRAQQALTHTHTLVAFSLSSKTSKGWLPWGQVHAERMRVSLLEWNGVC